MPNDNNISEVPEPVVASRDADLETDNLEYKEELELEETVELAKPDGEAEPPEYEDQVVDHDDPRLLIAKKHDEQNRQFEDEESIEESDDELEDGESLDIITNEYGDELVEAVVLGETRLVEKSKVEKAGGLTNYQKQAAADERLRQANSKEQDLERREREIAQREEQLRQAAPSSDVQDGQNPELDPPTSGDQEDVRELAKRYNAALLDGEEDEAADIMAKMVSRTRGTQIDPEKLVDRVASTLDERNYQESLGKAFRGLVSEHPELDRESDRYDPILFRMVDEQTTTVARDNPGMEPADVMNKAYSQIQSWRGKPNKTSMSKKAESKRSMNRPRASTGSPTSPPPAPEPTASDYVAKVRASRGQGV